jgi:hypothetical protein
VSLACLVPYTFIDFACFVYASAVHHHRCRATATVHWGRYALRFFKLVTASSYDHVRDRSNTGATAVQQPCNIAASWRLDVGVLMIPVTVCVLAADVTGQSRCIVSSVSPEVQVVASDMPGLLPPAADADWP